MRVSKDLLKDCLIFPDLSKVTSTVMINCFMDCAKCGLNVHVAEERRQRIRAGDWSWRLTEKGQKIAYLYVGGESDDNDQQNDTDGTARG